MKLSSHIKLKTEFTGCPKTVASRLCGCYEGASALSYPFFAQLERTGFNLEFKILLESIWEVVVDLQNRKCKTS